MSFIKRFFKKSVVKKLLSGGLIFSKGQQKYYVDSDTLIGLKEKEVTIFRNEIREILNNDFNDTSESIELTELEKNEIALQTKKVLESEGFNVIISQEFPLEFSVRNK